MIDELVPCAEDEIVPAVPRGAALLESFAVLNHMSSDCVLGKPRSKLGNRGVV